MNGVVIFIVAVFSVVMISIFGAIVYLVWQTHRLFKTAGKKLDSVIQAVNTISTRVSDLSAAVETAGKGIAQKAETAVGEVTDKVRQTTAVFEKSVLEPAQELGATMSAVTRFLSVLFGREK